MAVTWLFLGVGQAIIPHLKVNIQGYILICDGMKHYPERDNFAVRPTWSI